MLLGQAAFFWYTCEMYHFCARGVHGVTRGLTPAELYQWGLSNLGYIDNQSCKGAGSSEMKE